MMDGGGTSFQIIAFLKIIFCYLLTNQKLVKISFQILISAPSMFNSCYFTCTDPVLPTNQDLMCDKTKHLQTTITSKGSLQNKKTAY